MILGICQCGCGGETSFSLVNTGGYKVGERRKFIHGHWHRSMRQSNPNYGEKYRRREALDGLRVRFLNGEDVSGHFTTQAGLGNFISFTKSNAHLPRIERAPFPSVVRPPQDVWDEFRAWRISREEMRQHAEYRRQLQRYARLVRASASPERRFFILTRRADLERRRREQEQQRDERDYARLQKEILRMGAAEVRNRLRARAQQIKLQQIEQREKSRAAKCFQWDETSTLSLDRLMGDSQFSLYGCFASSAPTPFEELMAKEEEEEYERECRFREYLRRVVQPEWQPGRFPVFQT